MKKVGINSDFFVNRLHFVFVVDDVEYVDDVARNVPTDYPLFIVHYPLILHHIPINYKVRCTYPNVVCCRWYVAKVQDCLVAVVRRVNLLGMD